jgi:hypothetical protein
MVSSVKRLRQPEGESGCQEGWCMNHIAQEEGMLFCTFAVFTISQTCEEMMKII